MRAARAAWSYPPGSVLPTQEKLAEQYDVSRDVIQRAVRQLQGEGHVETHRRKGTVVRPRRTVRRRWSPDNPRGGPYSDWHGEPLPDHRMDIWRVEVVAADAELAAWLEIPEGSEVTCAVAVHGATDGSIRLTIRSRTVWILVEPSIRMALGSN